MLFASIRAYFVDDDERARQGKVTVFVQMHEKMTIEDYYVTYDNAAKGDSYVAIVDSNFRRC